jgi:hypothetical protein
VAPVCGAGLSLIGTLEGRRTCEVHSSGFPCACPTHGHRMIVMLRELAHVYDCMFERNVIKLDNGVAV